MSAHQGGWTTQGSDRMDAAVIVAYLTRIVCREQAGRDEEIVRLMASSMADALCTVLELNSTAVAFAAQVYAASSTAQQAMQAGA